MGTQFAARYPKIASRLQLDGNGSADPHVERLIESFAFLTARVQCSIDNDLPEITTALLGLLYPHFVEPVPPMSVAQFTADPEQGVPLSGYTLPRNTSLFADTMSGETCKFRTCYPVTLWPLELTEIRVESPRKYDFLDRFRKTASVLRLRLQVSGEASFQALDLSKLRLFLGGEPPSAYGLYELLNCNLLQVVVVSDRAPKEPAFRPPTAMQPVGFEPGEDIFPRPATAHRGYGLLQEYFTFPEKFLFFDVELGRENVQKADRYVDVLLLLDAVPSDRISFDSNSFKLGCVPIVNLFPKVAEPIRLDHRTAEYQLVADRRLEQTTRIHSIMMVSAASDTADRTGVLEPIFSYRHALGDDESEKAYWWAQRRRVYRDGVADTDIYLTFVDLSFTPKLPANETIFAHTLCTNRDLAPQIPPGAILQVEESAPVKSIINLRRPTEPLEAPLGGEALWQLVSLLSLNQISLTAPEVGLDALREILRLHDFSPTGAGETQLRGMTQLTTRQVLRQVGPDAWRGFCRGIEASVTLDESLFVGASAILLGAVLSRFLGLYTSVNSFTQLVVRSSRRQGIWKQWPPMAGEQIVL
jgi:type VI secretion system protein ImpG